MDYRNVVERRSKSVNFVKNNSSTWRATTYIKKGRFEPTKFRVEEKVMVNLRVDGLPECS
jgi:hypothetical protein